MNEYMKARYHRRRNEFLAAHDDKCASCGSRDDLEIDHVEAQLKSFDIGRVLASGSEDRVQAELAKCQVLCSDCHADKSRTDIATKLGIRKRWEHGTLGGYRHCKCAPCREAKSIHSKAYSARSQRDAGSCVDRSSEATKVRPQA